MILEIDAGNTFIKWRVLDGVRVVCRGRLLTQVLSQAVPAGWPADIAQVRVASVAGPLVASLLTGYCRSLWQLEPRFALTSAAAAGVRNSYAEPSRMGVDRWLVMLAAYNKCRQACCIVDCGSAITVDYLSADGQHQGGYIIPGLRLMSRSLLANTAEVIVDQDISRFSTEPGCHTSAAVGHGANYLFEALQQRLVRDLRQRPEPTALFVTGGDGELFHRLAGQGNWCPDLVLDGLVWALG